MKYTIFSGCLVQTRFPEYEKSARLILNKLGLEFEFVDNFSCCGSQIVESIDENKLLLIDGRNLALAERKNIDIILTLCGSCTYILKKMHLELQDDLKRQKMNQKLSKIGLSLDNHIQIKHFAEFLNENKIFRKFRSQLKIKLPFKLALQNPCMLYRPERISQIDKDEKSLISNLLKECGSEIVFYEFQDQCCEGTSLAFKNSIGEPLVKMRYEVINKLDIDLFAVGCPNCYMVYNVFPSTFHSEMVPSVFFTQLLGLALGYAPIELGLNRNTGYKRIKILLESKSIDKIFHFI